MEQVEILTVQAQTVLDIGAGQGYLAQVLNFQYQLYVVGIDASSHHSTVTSARAARIMKHYAAKMRKSQTGTKELNLPQTLAFQVLSSDALKTLSNSIAREDICKQRDEIKKDLSEGLQDVRIQPPSCDIPNLKSSLVLAGLHACGDLSVTMLRTFLDCEEIKAVISIGCCYNLLSDEGFENVSSQRGFSMSCVDLAGISFGKSARNLACQAMYASTAISTGMKGATKAMVAMNKQMAPAKQAKVIKEFQESSLMDMTVPDEIGVDIASQLLKVGSHPKKVENVVPARSGSTDVEDLEKRLASLRRI
ncbi:hypothetical protein IFM89_013204 [Coptis chinensis]|uniref:Methyltransferase domain-containing protein n=1 Tax=Coptis chinensis TaxID=261450 RepID=A0A835ING1_9MAGN|nr:hypothetical protein IFM89_013204 [Coptis chinensis]